MRSSSVSVSFCQRLGHGDLDVDLHVGGIDARRIVDGVGIDPPAPHGELDARPLGDAEIGALAYDLGVQLGGGDADGVVRAVIDVGVGLAGRADIGADTAEPEQIGLRLQHRTDESRSATPLSP